MGGFQAKHNRGLQEDNRTHSPAGYGTAQHGFQGESAAFQYSDQNPHNFSDTDPRYGGGPAGHNFSDTDPRYGGGSTGQGNDPFMNHTYGAGQTFSDKPYTNKLLQQKMTIRGEAAASSHPMSLSGDPASIAMLILLPWLMFTLICCLFVFQFIHLPVLTWLTIVLCGVYGFLLVWEKSRPQLRHRFWMSLGLLCILAVVVSTICGLDNYYRNILPYWTYADSRRYTNVLASESSGAKADAGMITFSIDSHIDPTRAVGYKAGNVYCVAPILSDNAPIGYQAPVGYWAAGLDCCSARGQFSCDEAWNKDARSGLVLKDMGLAGHDDPMLPEFQKAAEAAAAAYDLRLSPTPLFLRWVQDADGVHKAYWDSAESELLFQIFAIYLPFSLVAGVACYFVSRTAPLPGWAPSKSFVA